MADHAGTAHSIIDLQNTPPPVEWGVTIDLQAIDALAAAWSDTEFTTPSFDYPGTPTERPDEWWFDYVTLAVSVLACLWPPKGDDIWHREHEGVWLDDAPGIFACFTDRVVDNTLDLAWFADMSERDALELFAGCGTLQLIDERAATLRSTAQVLQDRWHGSARNLVQEAGRDGRRIVELLIASIPAFDDRPATPAGIAHFDKLAHLAAAIMASGQGWDQAGFSGYDDFPVYPDYMLPRVFRHYGAMRYSTELAQAVDTRALIPAGSKTEYALRWATVYCGAQLTANLRSRGVAVTGPAMDYHLWSIAVLGPDANTFGEHHRTLTMRY